MRVSALAGGAAKWIGRFARAEGGNTAMMFGLTAIVLLSAAGAGIDFTRAVSAKNRMSGALDAAALAVGGAQDLNQSELEALAQSYFDANFPDDAIGSPSAVSVDVSEDSVRLSVTGSVPTTLLGVAGIESLAIDVENEVVRGSLKLEVALVLDNTGSMSGSKLSSLKSAAKTLVDTLSSNQASPTKVKFGVVPFAQTVRLDTQAALAGGWMDTGCQSSVAKLNFSNDRCAFTVLDTMKSATKWGGCIEARPNGLEILDTAPSAGNPNTRWVPYFQPDEPDDEGNIDDDYTHSYLDDGTNTSNELTRLTRYQKYNNKDANNHVNANCTNLGEILPLTNNMNAVKLAINGMQAVGYTHIALGAGWGWRVLSPTAPYSEGVGYDDDETLKVMILMTDGENTVPSQSTMNKSQYTAYGYLRQGRLGTTTSLSTAESTLDTMLADVCENIKAQGIRVYTIGFDINSSNVQNLLKNCATNQSMYHNSPSSSALQTAFSAIATDLSNLRLSK